MPKNSDKVNFMDELDLDENEDQSEEQSLNFLLELDDKTKFHFKEDNFSNKFFKSLNQFRSTESFCDIAIKVHNQIILAHRVVIAASIPYFHAMFSCVNMLENVTNEVEIKEDNVSYSTFEKIIDYAYSGEITLNLSNVQEICFASSFLCINTLLNASIQFIINNLDHTNILEYKSFSKYFPVLESHVENFISEEFVNIYQTSAFMELSYEEVKKIVSNNELNIDDEKIVYEAVINWVKSDEENRKKYLYSLLEQIKLPYISPDYIVDNIVSEDLIKKCLKCRDLIDEAKDWHLLPQRRNLIQNHRTIKRAFTKRESPIIAIGTEGKSPEEKITYFEVYNPVKDQWNVWITEKRQLKSRTSICVTNNLIYFIGGYEEGIRTNNVEVYSLNDRKWTQVGHLNEKRSALASVFLNGSIYVIGGYNGIATIRSCEVYDPKLNKWTYISDMNNNRCSSSAVVCNGAIYVIGGHDGCKIFKSIEKYDPISDKWEIVSQMTKERCRLGATSVNNKLYIAGGFTSSHIDENTFECFDLTKNEWTSLKPMSKARSRFSLVSNGRKIYAISGCEKNSIINSVEVYDIDKDEWSFVSSMNSVENPAAASLINLKF